MKLAELLEFRLRLDRLLRLELSKQGKGFKYEPVFLFKLMMTGCHLWWWPLNCRGRMTQTPDTDRQRRSDWTIAALSRCAEVNGSGRGAQLRRFSNGGDRGHIQAVAYRLSLPLRQVAVGYRSTWDRLLVRLFPKQLFN